MKFYGATVHLISRENGGFEKCIKLAKKYANENDSYLLNQFSSEANIMAHYETTGKEIFVSKKQR